MFRECLEATCFLRPDIWKTLSQTLQNTLTDSWGSLLKVFGAFIFLGFSELIWFLLPIFKLTNFAGVLNVIFESEAVEVLPHIFIGRMPKWNWWLWWSKHCIYTNWYRLWYKHFCRGIIRLEDNWGSRKQETRKSWCSKIWSWFVIWCFKTFMMEDSGFWLERTEREATLSNHETKCISPTLVKIQQVGGECCYCCWDQSTFEFSHPADCLNLILHGQVQRGEEDFQCS